ncbi:hypothetical protein ACFL1R_01915 [Candidatus Latescibacterota bacterium]
MARLSDAGSIPAASTSLRSNRSENEDCRAEALAKAGKFTIIDKFFDSNYDSACQFIRDEILLCLYPSIFK